MLIYIILFYRILFFFSSIIIIIIIIIYVYIYVHLYLQIWMRILRKLYVFSLISMIQNFYQLDTLDKSFFDYLSNNIDAEKSLEKLKYSRYNIINKFKIKKL